MNVAIDAHQVKLTNEKALGVVMGLQAGSGSRWLKQVTTSGVSHKVLWCSL